MNTHGWERIAEAAVKRINQLGITKIEVVRRADVSESLVRKLCAGTLAVSPAKLAQVDRALGWPAGTLTAVGQEGTPPPKDMMSDPELLRDLNRRLDTLEDTIRVITVSLEQMAERRS